MSESMRQRRHLVIGNELSDSLLSHLQQLPTTLYPPKKPLKEKISPESEYQQLVKVISEKIHRYLKANPEDFDIREWLNVKWDNDEIDKMIEAENVTDLLSAKTLQRCFDDKKASRSSVGLLNAYFYIVEKEQHRQKEVTQHLSRISGLYYAYAPHSSTPGKLQESICWIMEDGRAAIRYVDINYELSEKYYIVELIGTTGLLLSAKEEDNILQFYLYIGAIHQPPFLQSVLMYSNRDGNTVANLAVFQRINIEDSEGNEIRNAEERIKRINQIYKDFEPTRERDTLRKHEYLKAKVQHAFDLTVGQNIQYFLQGHIRPLASLQDRKVPFDFATHAAPYPGSNAGTALFYTHYRKFCGKYFLYFNEGFPSIEIKEKNGEFSSVGQGVMDIDVDKITGEITAGLSIQRKENDRLLYQGRVINDELSNNSYLILSFYNEPHRDRYINFLFNIIDDYKLIGAHNTAYSPPGKIGSGIVVALRTTYVRAHYAKNDISPKEETAPKPTAHDPRFLGREDTLEKKVQNYLSFNTRSLVRIPDYATLDQYRDTIYQGIYRLYYPRLQGGIKVSALKIYPNGAVNYLDSVGNKAFGRIEQPNPNMLTFTLQNQSRKQLGYSCIRVDNIPPDNKQDGQTRVFYSGTFTGFTRSDNQAPLAARFLMEFCQKETADSQFFQELPYIVNPGDKMPSDIEPGMKRYLDQERSLLYHARPVFRLSDINGIVEGESDGLSRESEKKHE